MTEEKYMSEEESLRLISSMINRAKNRFSENGFQYLLWGWSVLACCIIQFVTVKILHMENGYIIWMALWLVAIYQIIYVSRMKKTVRTYTDDLVGFIWFSFFIVTILLVFICLRSGRPQMIDSVLLALYGIPVFLSGGLIKFKPLIIGAFACWILAAVSLFIAPDYTILLVAAAIIIAWIIPGYLMGARHKKEQSDEIENEMR